MFFWRANWPGLRSSIVAMMQSAEPLLGNDATESLSASSVTRCFFPKPQVSTILVVVPNIFEEQPFQVSLIDSNHMIEEIVPTAFDPAFGHAILPRASETRFAPRSCAASERWPEPPVHISNPGQISESEEPIRTETPPGAVGRATYLSDAL